MPRRTCASTGRILRAEGYTFDVAFTSVLKRAISTLWHVLEEMDLQWIPVTRDYRLNERHYGALQVRGGERWARRTRPRPRVPPRPSPLGPARVPCEGRSVASRT